jgi:nucleoside phosphorylase
MRSPGQGSRAAHPRQGGRGHGDATKDAGACHTRFIVTTITDVLIVAAFHPELAPLKRTLGEAMSGRVGNLVVTARAVGIGLSMAAVGAAIHVGEVRPRAVVLVGTCGAYVGAALAIGDVVVARRVQLVAPSALAGASQFPEPMSLALDANTGIAGGLVAAGGRLADVATTLAVTVDDATAGRIAQATGASAEHLEAHGVATACAARGVPFGAALGVANIVGARAREEWRAHHRASAETAANAVLRWLLDSACVIQG